MEHNFCTKQKILNLCFTWHILRCYRFVGEVTFKVKQKAFLSFLKNFQLTEIVSDPRVRL